MMTTEEKKREFERIFDIEKKVTEVLFRNGMGKSISGCKWWSINAMILDQENGDTYVYNDALKSNYIFYYLTKKELIKAEVHIDGKKWNVDIEEIGE